MSGLTYRVFAIAMALALPIFLGACQSIAAFSAVSVVATDKTLDDHLISYASNKDCSRVRQELGLTYCKEDDLSLQDGPKLHCYRELGKVTCYEQADYASPRRGVEDRTEKGREWERMPLTR